MPETRTPELGSLLRGLRVQKKVKLRQVAGQCGVSTGRIGAIEGGELPTVRLLEAMAELFEVDPAPLLAMRAAAVEEAARRRYGQTKKDEQQPEPTPETEAPLGPDIEPTTALGCPLCRLVETRYSYVNAFCAYCPESIPVQCQGACNLGKADFSACPEIVRRGCPCASPATVEKMELRRAAYRRWQQRLAAMGQSADRDHQKVRPYLAHRD